MRKRELAECFRRAQGEKTPTAPSRARTWSASGSPA